jgi:DNA repair protein RecO (recombination protein O)
MTKTYKTEAIIVKRINLGESDRIVTALSSDNGKIRFVAKGVRKIKSKFGGNLEPFYKSELLLVTGKNLDILSNAQIKDTYLPTKPDLEQLKAANLIGEIIDRIVPDNERDPELFSLLEKSLQKLDDPRVALLFFESQFYRHSGVFPYITKCVRCQESSVSYFSLHANGALCENCRRQFADSLPVKSDTLIFWQRLSNDDISDISYPAEDILKEASDLSSRYLTTLTNYRFKSNLI